MTTVTQRSEIDMTCYNVGEDPVHQGEIALRWRKMIYVGDQLKVTEYHRAMLNPSDDVEAVLNAIATDLEQQGYPWDPKIIDLDKQIISFLTGKIWTPEIIAAYTARRHPNITGAGLLRSI